MLLTRKERSAHYPPTLNFPRRPQPSIRKQRNSNAAPHINFIRQSMVKLGVLGLNEGNGHPFSLSAIFNGYDPRELATRCPFALIRDYLPREHRNEVFVTGAKVTHIWTQDRSLSEDVARVSLIPNIVNNFDELIGKVDAVILARDDPWNHCRMAEPFLQHRMPIFIDKQLAATEEDMSRMLALAGPDYPWMAGSSVRYARDLTKTKAGQNCMSVQTIHGVSRVNWLRYGHHLFEGIACIWGLGIDWVGSLSEDPKHDIVQIRYKSGLNATLEFAPDMPLPIQFTCFPEQEPAFSVSFTDYFYSFHQMMKNFLHLVTTGQSPIPRDEMIGIAKVILAGDISKRNGGSRISPSTLTRV